MIHSPSGSSWDYVAAKLDTIAELCSTAHAGCQVGPFACVTFCEPVFSPQHRASLVTPSFHPIHPTTIRALRNHASSWLDVFLTRRKEPTVEVVGVGIDAERLATVRSDQCRGSLAVEINHVVCSKTD